MPTNVGGLLRSLIAQARGEGLSYNDTFHTAAEAGVAPTSDVFAREWRYSIGLETGIVDMRGRAGATARDLVPTSDSIVESPVRWPDRFNARVEVYGRDHETGKFGHRWLNIGFDRLPTYGAIADTGLVTAMLGEGHYEFEAHSVSGIIVESSSAPRR